MKMTPRTALTKILMTIFILLAGCQANLVQPLEPTRLVPTPDLALTTSIHESTATVAPTMTPCLETHGQVLDENIDTQLLPWPLEFTVYLPPCYSNTNPQVYPVLYMLHGQANRNDQWARLGLLDAADELIGTGKITPMIIVMPYEISWSVGPEKSKYGEALLTDLFPYIEKSYNA